MGSVGFKSSGGDQQALNSGAHLTPHGHDDQHYKRANVQFALHSVVQTIKHDVMATNAENFNGIIKIGTRGSPLALAQANMVRDLLMAAHPGMAVDLSIIKTSGDQFLDRPLADIGGKGLFTKEIEDALLAGEIDIAVHSMKDVPTALPLGLGIFCMLVREDPRDALLVRDASINAIENLPQGARVGTASLRRRAQLLSVRPDLDVISFRGNVGTRMRKLEAGEADATLLAMAGLNRLGMASAASVILSTDDMLPAVAQGAVGIECREDDARVRDLLGPLNDVPTGTVVAAERALLAELDGSCRTPIAALALIDDGGGLSLVARVFAPDGGARFDAMRTGNIGDGEAMGRDAGQELRALAGTAFFESLKDL